MRVTERGLPPSFFGDDVPVRRGGISRGTVRRAVMMPALVEDVTIQRGPAADLETSVIRHKRKPPPKP